MREVMKELMQLVGRPARLVGVGTVVGTWRSAPRQPGASMLVGPGGEAVGSVSGGCVEGAVYELGQEVVASGTPVLQRYGISDDDAYRRRADLRRASSTSSSRRSPGRPSPSSARSPPTSRPAGPSRWSR